MSISKVVTLEKSKYVEEMRLFEKKKRTFSTFLFLLNEMHLKSLRYNMFRNELP